MRPRNPAESGVVRARRNAITRAAGALAMACSVLVAPALHAAVATYPSKPIRLIVPFAPGGGNDTVARTVAQRLSSALGQPVVVDNRPGAGGVLGAELAAKAPADGYTLFLGGVGSHAINPNLQRNMPYDPLRDFAPVSLIAAAPLIIVVHPSLPVKSVPDLIALAKSKPGALNYASNGNGSSSHLAAAMFESMTGTRMVHVPYKGLSPALQDLVTGQVQLMFSSVVGILPQVNAGKLRAIAVTSTNRLPLVPDLPTVAESGVPQYQSSSWYGILAPAGTPRDVVERLNSEIVRAVRDPEVQKVLASDGAVPIGSTPDEFAAHIRGELERLGKVIREARIEPQ
jgi:tripartite-type tricarboxylate transporter receptor subunit TctC